MVVLGLVAGACQSSTTIGAPSEPIVTTFPVDETGAEESPRPSEPGVATATPAAAPSVDLSDDLTTTIDNIASAFTTAVGAWPGFEPNDYPVVLALKDDDGSLNGALAINHPAADALGTATALDISDTAFVSLHLVADPAERAALQALEAFNFRVVLGGVDSFAMVAGGDEFFVPTTKMYASTLVHEMFHVYQTDVFAERGGSQDIDGYDYSPESLVLIGLEQRALRAAIGADSRSDRELAARHVVAIRNTRLAADPRVALDGRQEIREGTARYVEHVLGGNDTSYPYHLGNFADQLTVDIPDADIKATMAFGRWYASGAATMHLLSQLDAEDVSTRIDRGERPVDVLAQLLAVEPMTYDSLVADALAAYDPDNELAEQARIAGEAVRNEPSFWGGANTATDDAGAAELEQVALTQQELDCLVERGAIITNEVLEISNEDWAACYGQP